MWLGETRGNLLDWCTQKWCQLTGRRIDLAAAPWLSGPVGSTHSIEVDQFRTWASTQGLELRTLESGRGLIPSFAALAGEGFGPSEVQPGVVEFYENAADFDSDVWSEWGWLFKPFGSLTAAVMSRRLRQLNLPLSPLDTSWGMTSEVTNVVDRRTSEVRAAVWHRTLVKTGLTIYSGIYSVALLPQVGPCVKTVFPLPNGNAVVLFRPTVGEGGSLVLVSEGRRYGDPGFYFTVRGSGKVWAKYVRQLRTRIHVYPAGTGVVRADQVFTLWGLKCLHMHFRLTRRSSDGIQRPNHSPVRPGLADVPAVRQPR